MEFWTSFILLLLVIRLSGTEGEKKNLTGTKGGNITLPDPLLERGFLLFGGNNIALVDIKGLEIIRKIYNNRIHWNKSSGLFTLTDLQKRDSGIYIIDSIEVKVFSASYNLTVYDSVAPPAVQTLSVSSDSCYLLCAVDKAAEITLWWYKDQEVVDQSSSAGSLPLNVTKQDFNSSYRCVAGTPAENKTLLVDLQTFCSLIDPNSSSENNHRHDSLDSTTEVEYTGVNICADRHSQGGNFPDSPGPADRCNLSEVVYHRIDPDSEGHV